ncbi:MAG: histidine kinase [Ignavibacteria bacterium GWA2_35_9]|nr:MAG: histidine kinase [Ignavibacteria bacterium GWA2_35_9]OGU45741.1 MAG: histidine kinase [Ignavibacteria bacterium GWB2_36_8]OGU53400.1 MAG: histidine kinase [Ignavibacteria bacterium GWC2_36_12]
MKRPINLIFKNFTFNILIRVLLFSGAIVLFIYLLMYTELYATLVVVFVFAVFIFYSLIHYVSSTNRQLSRFLLSVRHSDFSQTFVNTTVGSSFEDLNKSFNEVIQKFLSTRSEKEENYRFLQTVMQHVGVGLISFNVQGKIEFVNNAAKKLFNITHLTNISTLNNINDGLAEKFLNLGSGEKATIKIVTENDITQLIVYATEFKQRDQKYTLVSLQNIETELEEKEMEAWQRLIRVLTHEIMNSITPISSLAGTVTTILSNNNKFDEEVVEDIKEAISTIKKRSEGLIHFVDNYRTLTKVPKPDFKIFQIKELFRNIEKLMRQQMKEKGIKFSLRVDPETLELTADSEQIEQVIINLMVNSTFALDGKENPAISLTANLDEKGNILIKVIDNGPGIPEEAVDKIFIPFFSTKKNGSGVGLSLSRQIMRSHGGNIRVNSKPGETTFTLKF